MHILILYWIEYKIILFLENLHSCKRTIPKESSTMLEMMMMKRRGAEKALVDLAARTGHKNGVNDVGKLIKSSKL